MAASLSGVFSVQQFTDNGTPLVGGRLYSYVYGTTTQKTAYTDAAGSISQTYTNDGLGGQYMALDARGELPAPLYLSAGSYDIALKRADGSTVWTRRADPIGDATAAVSTGLLATTGAWLIGFIHTAIGAVGRTLGDKALDIVSVLDFMSTAQRADVRTNAASLDVKAPLQLAATHGDMPLPNGTMRADTGFAFNVPVSMIGRGPKSVFVAPATFPIGTDYFTISPGAATENRNWQFENFQLNNYGTNVRNVFLLDIVAAGKYLNKLRIKGVIAGAVTGYFVQLLNTTPNVDGLFTSVFEDNWSLNGYYLENVGDSVILQRNTTTGAGRGYYVDQLPGASHIIIRDGNCTSTGGVLIAHAFNLTFENMQNECSEVYTGTGTGLITLQNGGGALITNVRIRDNNINTHGATNTTLACLYINNSDGIEIDGNTLFTNAATGAHIIITSASSNVYIGPNKYYNQSGAEIAAIISDSGVGTMGIWKDATEATWTTGGLAFFKGRDGTVSLRGNLSGAASTVGQVITTLPVGFRPSTAQILVAAYGSAIAAVQIDTAGVVTLTVNGQTSCNFDGLTFSAK